VEAWDAYEKALTLTHRVSVWKHGTVFEKFEEPLKA
jgi:hypothetical protein